MFLSDSESDTRLQPDEKTGLYYYRARYYDPSIGRFISEDRIGFSGDINFYRYASNSPVVLDDPQGLRTICVRAGAGSASRLVCWDDGKKLPGGDVVLGLTLPEPSKPDPAFSIATDYAGYKRCLENIDWSKAKCTRPHGPKRTMNFEDPFGVGAEPDLPINQSDVDLAVQYAEENSCFRKYPLAPLDPNYHGPKPGGNFWQNAVGGIAGSWD